MMMYELHLPLLMLSNRALQKGPGSPGVKPGQIKSDLKAALFNLRLSLEILKDEPEDSFEPRIATLSLTLHPQAILGLMPTSGNQRLRLNSPLFVK